MIPFLALHSLGIASGSEGFAMADGMRFLIGNYPQKLNSVSPATALAPEVPWPTIFLGLFFLCTQSWCTHQSFIICLFVSSMQTTGLRGSYGRW